MACDITDPVLKNILYPPNPPENFLRPSCEIITDGWFGNGTLAKVKTIMRWKIQTLIEDRPPRDSDFWRVIAFPDHAYTEADLGLFTVPLEGTTSREVSMATETRASIKGAPLWRKMHDRGRGDLDGEKMGVLKRARGKGKKGKAVVFEAESEEEVNGGGDGDESEGEEEEMERVEMWEEQAAAAVKAREDALAEEDENGNENEDEEEDEDEEDELDDE
jgi:general transcription factor 3C polypeptide 5 (transcription factor C subunit 1)